MNFHVNINICRVCMKSEEGTSLLEDVELQTKFVFTTRLKLNKQDSMPSIICAKCVTRLKISHDFIQLAHESEKNLRAFLEKVSRDFQQVTKYGPNKSKEVDAAEDEELLSLVLEDEISAADDLKQQHPLKVQQQLEQEVTAQKQNVCATMKLPNQQQSPSKKVESAVESHDENAASFAVTPLEYTVPELITYKYEVDEDDLGEFVNLKQSNVNETCDNAIEANAANELEEEFMDGESQTDLEILDETLQQDEETQSSENVEQPQHSGGFLKQYQATLAEDDEFLEDSNSLNEATGVAELNLYNADSETVLQNQEEQQMPPEILDESELELETLEETQAVSISHEQHVTSACISSSSYRKRQTDNRAKTRRAQAKSGGSSKTAKKASISPLNTRFYCFKCNRDFSTKTNLTRHMMTHEGNRPFQCNVCDKGFTQNASLKQHMYTHTGEKPHVCEICHRGFTQCKTLVFHMRRHTGEKPFPCEKCGALFRQKDGLKAHILKRHTITAQHGNTELHTCSICKKDLPDKYSLQAHMKKHVNNHKSVDSSVASSDELIAEHNSAMLLELMDDELLEEKPALFMNEYADDISSSAHVVDLTTTSASVPSRAKKFQCRKCFKCYAIKRNLIRHLTTHELTTTDEFSCRSCDFNCRSAEKLKEHRLRTHGATESELLQCEMCNLAFNSLDELNEHSNLQHAFRCTECPNVNFTTRRLLTEHLMEHEFSEIK